ncbi:hypothetical protein AAW14_27920 [Streptomyces hygroscopicus]|nr:hypothetical protein [Streptomyces hygroscopicus]
MDRLFHGPQLDLEQGVGYEADQVGGSVVVVPVVVTRVVVSVDGCFAGVRGSGGDQSDVTGGSVGTEVGDDDVTLLGLLRLVTDVLSDAAVGSGRTVAAAVRLALARDALLDGRAVFATACTSFGARAPAKVLGADA